MSLGKSKQSSKVKIPQFLRPFLQSAAGLGQNALETLNQNVFNPVQDFVAGFAPQEELAQILGTQRALNPNSGFRTATDIFRSTAEGTPISEYLPKVAMDGLSTLAGGGSNTQGSSDIIQRLLGSDVASRVGDLEFGGQQHLQDVVGGKYLYGGDGFNAALDAAMKRILPAVQTQFGRSGAGGGTGTLAAEAFGDRAAERFAMQYGQERGRQDSAANILNQLGLAEGDFDLARAGLNLQETGMLGDYLNSRDSLSSNASQILAGLAGNERDRQMMAAEALPGIENLDLNLLSAIGGDIRGLEQARIDAPFQRQMMFLQQLLSSLGAAGAPIGQSGSGSSRSISFGG